METPACRRLGAFVRQLSVAETRAASSEGGKRWRRVQRRDWRVGDKFVLTPDADELSAICLAHGTPRTAGVPSTGWTGELVKVERGDPVAWCVFDAEGQEGKQHPLPLDAAGRWEEAADAAVADAAPGLEEEDGDDALAELQMAALVLEEEIPVVVMDAMLPGQTSGTFASNLPLLVMCRHGIFFRQVACEIAVFFVSDEPHKAMLAFSLQSESKSFGMIGMDGSTGKPLLTGVEAVITNLEVMQTPDGQQEKLAVSVQGGRQFELVDGLRSASRHPRAGYSVANVMWSEDDDDSTGLDDELAYTRRADARARTDEQWEALGEAAIGLLGLVNTWLGLVRDGRERQEGQIDQVLEDLGPMPQPMQRPGALSLWVGALINPLPSLGVAWEVRPGLLKVRFRPV